MTPLERKALKARAHPLNPVVFIGDKGLTAEVVAEVDRALGVHELIKVRAAGLEREARELALAELAAQCGAEPVQHIGKVLVLYRKKLDEPDSIPPSRRPPPKARR
jgi:RNA-binding protein